MCNNVSADVMLAGHIKTVVQQVSMYVNHFTQKTLDGGQVELTIRRCTMVMIPFASTNAVGASNTLSITVFHTYL